MIRRLNYRTRLLILILGLSAAPYFVNLGASYIWDTDEAFYAETPREMIESGKFSDPAFNYRPRLNKPPLSYWMVAISYRLFGISERSERIPIALGAVIFMATAFFLGRAAGSVEAGLISAIAIAANPRFLLFARRIIIDVYVSVFLGLALLFFTLAVKAIDEGRGSRRRLYFLMMYLAIALAVATKGPVGLVLPALAFLLYVLTARRFALVRQMMLPVGFVLVAVIVLPCYATMYSSHGWSHISSFILGDNVSRYTSGTWGPSRSVLFYLPVLLGDLFPWSLIVIPALVVSLSGIIRGVWRRVWRRLGHCEAVRARAEYEEIKVGFDGLRMTAGPNLLLLLWIVSIVAFFSLSRGKEDLYILPIYPAAMAIVGGILSRFINQEPKKRRADAAALEPSRAGAPAEDGLRPPQCAPQWPPQYPPKIPQGSEPPNDTRVVLWTLIGAGAVIVATGCVGVYLQGVVPATLRLAGVVPVSATAICGGGLIILGGASNRRFPAVLAMMLTVATVNWIIVLRTLPDFKRFQPVPALAEIMKGRAGEKARVCYFKYPAPSLVYYLRRGIVEFSDDEREVVQGLLSSGKEVYCLTPESEFERLKSGTGPLFILARRPLFKLKFSGIHSGDDPPQVILVSNRSE